MCLCSKKAESLSSGKITIGTKEKVIIINELRQCHPLSQLLVIADLPRSTFYYHVKRLNAPDPYQLVKQVISDLPAVTRAFYLMVKPSES